MAVHVIPYNPWREQLALTALGNVAGDIIGDMWKAHRQNEQNRKANAFRGQLQQDLQNTAQDNISLMPQKAPAGYNANPWAAAFHQGNNPIAQFDIGTSAIGKTPSLQDIARASDTLAASPRFSMLDPKTVNDIRDNMMRNTIGDMFGNAGDITGQMNALTRGAAMGLVAPQVLAAFGPFGQKMAFPYSFGETDIGQSKVITARNEHTGEITPGLIMPVSVSPNAAATVQGSKDVANIHAGASMFGDTTRAGTENRRLDIQEGEYRYQHENPALEKHVDADGNVWMINPRTGNPELVRDKDGNPVKGKTEDSATTAARLRYLSEEYKRLTEQLKGAQQIAMTADTVEERQAAMAEIEELKGYIADNRAEYQSISQGNRTSAQPQPAPAPSPAQPVIGQPPASADLPAQPAPQTASRDIPQVTALQDTQPAPQATAQQDYYDFRPSYMRTNMSQAITGNQQLQPVTGKQTAKPKPLSIRLRTTKGDKDFTLPESLRYNGENMRDDDIYTPEHFRDLILELHREPKYAKLSVEQLIDLARRSGIKIRQ